MNLPYLKRLADKVGLVLASGSPRRSEILASAGIPFEISVPAIEETIRPGIAPDILAISLARDKVLSIPADGQRAYIGCDTIVVCDGQILTKPSNENDALRMLLLLSGKTHSVFTALALYDSREKRLFDTVEESRVTFNTLTEKELLAYIATGEPLDKAGVTETKTSP